MKIKLLLLLLSCCAFSSFARVGNDTITNWQLLIDNKVVLKGHEFKQVGDTIIINTKDDFRQLQLNIYGCAVRGNTRRKLLFTHNGKLIFTYIKEFKSSNDPIIISREQLLNIVGPDINKPLTLEFADGEESNGLVLGTLVIKTQ